VTASPVDRFLNHPGTRRVAMIVLLLFMTYFVIRVGRQAYTKLPGDWGVYYSAGIAMRERLPIYTLERGPMLTFKNAPVVALAAVPLGSLPRPVARIASLLIDFTLLTALMYLVTRLIFFNAPPKWPHAWVALAGCLLVYPFLLLQLSAGQTTVLFLACTVAGFYLAVRNHPTTAGLALALAICLKLVPLCFVPYLLFTPRPVRAIASTILCSAGLLLLPALWIGWQANAALLAQWPVHLRETNIPAQVWRLQNQGVLGQLARRLSITDYGINVASWDLASVRSLWLTLSVIFAGLLYAFVWRTRRDPHARATHLALLMTFMTIFNPLAWRYNFLALAIPYAVVVASILRRPHDRLTLILAVGSALFTPANYDAQIYGARLTGAVLLTAAVVSAYVNRENDSRRPSNEPGVLGTTVSQ